ncbi:AAA family ATPase [Chloroflexi bacterium TSY]|nr:AAA family ATPase [Chloroflexi bacterium TSY]
MVLKAPLEFRFLGCFQIRYKGQLITQIHQPRLQSLLAYLVLRHDVAQTRQQLAFLFWQETSEQQARTNLRNLLFQLRRQWPDAKHFLQMTRHAIQWRSDDRFIVDVVEFDQILQQAGAAAEDSDRMETLLMEAVALYKGDLLPTLYDDWIFPEQERLRRRYLQALEQLIALLETRREYVAAMNYAHLLLSHDPLREESYRHLMRLYTLNDDRVSATGIYHNCVATLWHELEVEPAPATQMLFEQLCQEKHPKAPLTQATILSTEENSSTPLIGRHAAWQELQRTWHRAIHDRPHVVLLTGETGIGNTRLAEEFLIWTRCQGGSTAKITCFASEAQCAFAPIVRLLQQAPFQQAFTTLKQVWRNELLELWPQLREGQSQLSSQPSPFTEWQRARIFEALAHLFLQARQPVLLVIDDLQWCDSETLNWLRYLLRFLREVGPETSGEHRKQPRLLIVGVIKSEECEDEQPLTAWRFALQQRYPVTEIELQPLDWCETAKLIVATLDRPVSDDFVDELYRQSEGVPFYILEILKAQEKKGVSEGDNSTEGRAKVLPVPIQQLLEGRLHHLSTTARELLALAAIVGNKFTLNELVAVSGLDEEQLVKAMEEALQYRLIVEERAGSYTFSHNLIPLLSGKRKEMR